jgi:hypothetical protein
MHSNFSVSILGLKNNLGLDPGTSENGNEKKRNVIQGKHEVSRTIGVKTVVIKRMLTFEKHWGNRKGKIEGEKRRKRIDTSSPM